MVDINQIVIILKQRIRDLQQKVALRRQDMVDQDSPIVSRYITSTRWLVEQEIESLDQEVVRLEKGIKELAKLSHQKNRYFSNYFVSDSFEYLELGIISKQTSLGQEILEFTANRSQST
jgi:hypothetical protein